MKKMKVILSVTIILALAVTGCGTKNSNTVESQKETVVKTADAKKTESQSKVSQKTTEESEEIDSEEDKTIVKEDEKAAAQQTASTDGNTSDNSPSNSSSGNNSSGNSNTGNGANSGNQNNSGNTASSSGNGNGGSSNSGSGSNANSSSGNSSNSNSTSTPTPAPAPQHTHTWTHVDAVGHYETVTITAAWDEEVPIYEEKARSICNQCGADITACCDEHMEAGMLAGTCWAWHIEYIQVQTGTQKIHHDAVTEQRWVQDTPAYDVCSGCGATR